MRAALGIAGVALLLAGCGGSSSATSTGTSTGSSSTHTSQPNPPTSSSTTAAESSETATVSPSSGAAPKRPAIIASGRIRLSSPAFRAGGTIPPAYTCEGADTPLPLRWSGVPKQAHELVLVMRDPDAPGGNFVHWAVAGIPPAATGLPASGTIEGRNGYGTVGYRGPCPPRGARPHSYVITLSALAGLSGLRTGFSADQLRTAALGLGILIGTYGRR